MPPDLKPAEAAKADAARHAQEATAALAKPTSNPSDLDKAMHEMDSARSSLESLAKQLPTMDQRIQKAIAEVAQLKDKQDQIRTDVERAIDEAKRAPTRPRRKKIWPAS